MSFNFERDTDGSPIFHTALEADVGDFKMARHKATATSGVATVEMKIPGTFPAVGRLMYKGEIWCAGTPHVDDWFKVEVVDVDNKTGAGAGAILMAYHDTGMPTSPDNQQGHWVRNGHASLGGIAGYGAATAELYIRTTITEGGGTPRNDDWYCVMHWLQPTT